MKVKIEKVILNSISCNEGVSRKIIPFLKDEYFHETEYKVIFKSINEYIQKYNSLPSKEAISISVDKLPQSDEESKNCQILIDEIFSISPDNNDEWTINESENFCKEKAVYNAILESIHIIDGKSQTKSENAIPSILSDALAVGFDTHIGHDYIEDADERYDFYHRKEDKVAFDLEMFNTITDNGTPRKTLNIILAGTGVGKSLFMCHHAAACLAQNKKVLYITCEMAEERIAERIDANLMDIPMDDLRCLPKDLYEKKLANATMGFSGKLIIKEYPTATANVNHFRHLLDELKLKKKFKPDIVFIDYLNICAAARFKNGANVNSYMYVKAIAEELRGLAVEMDVPIFSATQTNRGGFANTDVGLEDTSESFGLPATADFMFALISTEELDEQKQILVKQLKNRYNDLISNRKFVIGVDKSKMKLYDVSSNENNNILGTGYDADMGTEEKEKSKYLEKFTQWQI
jgi:replicative DNA helicase